MSGRPKLPIGTWGNINVVQLENGEFRASARFRENYSTTRRVSATGNTRASAERELKLRLSTESEKGITTGEINRYSNVSQLVAYWLAGLIFEDLTESTREKYAQSARTLVVPSIGKVQLHELNPVICDKWLKEHLRKSRSRAKEAKNILNQALGMAVSFGAITANPLRSLAALPASPIPVPRVLTWEEVQEVRKAIQEPERKKGKGGRLPDDRLNCIFEVLIGTGCRIGEALVLRRCDVDLESDQPSLTISGTLSLIQGGKEVRSGKTKTPASRRIIPISQTVVQVLRKRLESTEGEGDETLIFRTANGTAWSSTNCRRRLRKAIEEAGLESLQIHPHLFRKTVATEVDKQFGVRAAASLLGHASTNITEKYYLARSSRVDPKVGLAMELFAPTSQESSSSYLSEEVDFGGE